MGLDMYLKANRYVGGWNFSDEEETALYNLIIKAVGTSDLVTSDAPSIEVNTNVAYWRKANSIHAWFIHNLSDGVDDCKPVYVSQDSMKEIIADCHAALDLYRAGKFEEAKNKMSPEGGFFFGSTEVDECWADDLKNTIDQLTPLLDIKGFDFFYQASW